jgi:sulfate adenylyltransferase subunit 1
LDGALKEAFSPMSVSITLEDDIDVSRGDMISRTNNTPEATQEFDVMLCWLNNKAPQPRAKYTIMHANNTQKAIIKEVVYKIDINTLERFEEDKEFKMNDIGRVTIRTTKPLMIDSYRDNRITGSVILVYDATHETVAAGMVV